MGRERCVFLPRVDAHAPRAERVFACVGAREGAVLRPSAYVPGAIDGGSEDDAERYGVRALKKKPARPGRAP